MDMEKCTFIDLFIFLICQTWTISPPIDTWRTTAVIKNIEDVTQLYIYIYIYKGSLIRLWRAQIPNNECLGVFIPKLLNTQEAYFLWYDSLWRL